VTAFSEDFPALAAALADRERDVLLAQRVLAAERELESFRGSIEEQVSGAERAAAVAEAAREAAEEACAAAEAEAAAMRANAAEAGARLGEEAGRAAALAARLDFHAGELSALEQELDGARAAHDGALVLLARLAEREDGGAAAEALAGDLAELSALLESASAREGAAAAQVEGLQREVAAAEAAAEAARSAREEDVLALEAAADAAADAAAADADAAQAAGTALVATARAEGAALRARLRAAQLQSARRHGCVLVADRLLAQARALPRRNAPPRPSRLAGPAPPRAPHAR